MRHFIETHFGIVLLLSCVFGIMCPWLALLPDFTVVIALALLMFVSCYRLRDGGFSTLRWRDILLFYVARYVTLPVTLWFIAKLFAPDYATGVFLLSTLPAAVSSPAFAAIFGGEIAPAFAIAILSQLLTPFLIPLQFAWMGAGVSGPEPLALFTTMVWCIFLPMGIYALCRHHHRSAAYFYKENKLFSVLLVAFVIAMAIAKQRDIILTGHGLVASLLIAILCFMIYIVFGWFILRRRPREERITYAACSSFNNAALGVSLALLHFPPPVVLFVAVSEIGWSLLPLMFKTGLRVMGHGS